MAEPIIPVSTASISKMLLFKAPPKTYVAANSSGLLLVEQTIDTSSSSKNDSNSEVFFKYNSTTGTFKPVTHLSEVRANHCREFFQPLGKERSHSAAKILFNIKKASEEFEREQNDITKQKLINNLRQAKTNFLELDRENIPNQILQELRKLTVHVKDLLNSYRPAPDSSPRLSK